MDDYIDWRPIVGLTPLRKDKTAKLYTFNINTISSYCLEVEADSKEDAYAQVHAINLDILLGIPDEHTEIVLNFVNEIC